MADSHLKHPLTHEQINIITSVRHIRRYRTLLFTRTDRTNALSLRTRSATKVTFFDQSCRRRCLPASKCSERKPTESEHRHTQASKHARPEKNKRKYVRGCTADVPRAGGTGKNEMHSITDLGLPCPLGWQTSTSAKILSRPPPSSNTSTENVFSLDQDRSVSTACTHRREATGKSTASGDTKISA